MSTLLRQETIRAGDPFMARISAGQRVRLVDTEGNEAVDTFFFNAEDPRERYSAVDTVRRQRNVYLTTGTELVSNEDRTLLTIVDDTCGRHDTLGGACASESNTVRYAHDRKFMHSCRDNFLLALLNWNEDFSKRDLGPNINFFMNVPLSADGGLRFADGISGPGKYGELVAHMDVLILISNCPQLNNPCSGFNPTPVEFLLWDA